MFFFLFMRLIYISPLKCLIFFVILVGFCGNFHWFWLIFATRIRFTIRIRLAEIKWIRIRKLKVLSAHRLFEPNRIFDYGNEFPIKLPKNYTHQQFHTNAHKCLKVHACARTFCAQSHFWWWEWIPHKNYLKMTPITSHMRNTNTPSIRLISQICGNFEQFSMELNSEFWTL